MVSYADLYLQARNALMTTETAQDAGFMARQVLVFVTGKTQEEILANKEQTATREECRGVKYAVERLLEGEPLAYVLGEWDFYGLQLYVTPDVLIPRDDTCAVTELAIRNALFLQEAPRILDLCCGSGCIGLAVASRVTDARVTLADLSPQALAIAKKNIQRCHLGGRVSCIHADATREPSAFLGKFDMIVSNPPYITRQEMGQLPHSVKDYEPEMALFGGEDGLDFYRAICRNYAVALKKGGFLCFEFGMGQGDAVCRLLEENGYTIVERTRDYNDIERAVIAQYGRKEE